ncbi:MAG: hypothetical protein GY937_18955 [bacterium]|nr:hypothetical protein [bacterium]
MSSGARPIALWLALLIGGLALSSASLAHGHGLGPTESSVVAATEGGAVDDCWSCGLRGRLGSHALAVCTEVAPPTGSWLAASGTTVQAATEVRWACAPSRAPPIAS